MINTYVLVNNDTTNDSKIGVDGAHINYCFDHDLSLFWLPPVLSIPLLLRANFEILEVMHICWSLPCIVKICLQSLNPAVNLRNIINANLSFARAVIALIASKTLRSKPRIGTFHNIIAVTSWLQNLLCRDDHLFQLRRSLLSNSRLTWWIW